MKEQAAGHAERAKQALTSDQERGAVGAKLVPEGGEEVYELEDLGAGHAASQGAPQRRRQQKQNEIGQESNCLQQYTSPFRIQESNVLQQCNCLQDTKEVHRCSAHMSCQAAGIVHIRKQHATQLPKCTASGKSSYGLDLSAVLQSSWLLADATCVTGTRWLMHMRFIRALAQHA